MAVYLQRRYAHLFLQRGLQLNGFVIHHELLGYFSLGSGLVVGWGELYFANHQTACVPNGGEE